jgi:hypothetical protein
MEIKSLTLIIRKMITNLSEQAVMPGNFHGIASVMSALMPDRLIFFILLFQLPFEGL